MNRLRIAHISNGIIPTGGFRQEQSLLFNLTTYYRDAGFEVQSETIRANRFFEGLAAFKLLFWGFSKANADINIVTSRLALPALLRNIYSKRKVLILWHHYDEREGYKLPLRVYYFLLFWVLRTFQNKQVAVVTLAPFWVRFFVVKKRFNVPVLLFPCLFNPSDYKGFRTETKQKQIYLGQYSPKNDPQVFVLASRLKKLRYTCYFSTMNADEVKKHDGYDIICDTKENYLLRMASSEYTVAFTGINEGWNRVAHESILVGTTVIGKINGGLGDLIKESGSLSAQTVDEFIRHIQSGAHPPVNPDFISRYEDANSPFFLKILVHFMQSLAFI